MKYDLKDLMLFTYVAKLKSFVRAAEMLGISKAAASSRIGELEKALKLSLLIRTTREVNLTNEGRMFLDYCSSIVEKVENLDEFVHSYKGVSGALKLVLPPYFSRHHIVPYLPEFFKKYPHLKLEITLTENVVNIITCGYDLQIRNQIPENEDLEVSRLMSNNKVLCASPQYLRSHGTPQRPRDLLSHNCIVFGENTAWVFRHKVTGKKVTISDIVGNVSCDNGEIIKELILSGIGITIKSTSDIENEIKSGEIIVLLKDYDVINQTQFYAVYPSAKYMSPRIKAFVEFYQNKLG
ncbi:MAG: LysR, substrate-binding [Rickettsiaceae bacterium]|jgi:DNA-binding transcriptional LysR family regulator|nr:LysR, substrate-binding [Rickettsiaceae bacterium]